MYNVDSENVIVVFCPLTRGNFIRSCLTFSPNTADGSFKLLAYPQRLKMYKRLTSLVTLGSKFYGPGHIDKFDTYSQERFNHAEYAERYIHCTHLSEFKELYSKVKNRKIVGITLSEEEVSRLKKESIKNLENTIPVNIHDINKIPLYNENLIKDSWYNLPYNDILNKDKFLEHCVNIDKGCYVNMISEYYDEYYKNCIVNHARF